MAHEISGRDLLRARREAYRGYRGAGHELDRTVGIVRFTAADDDPTAWWARAEAARISAEQKERAFRYLGYDVAISDLPGSVSGHELADRLAEANASPTVSALIVQLPVPRRLRPLLDGIDPDKDIDALRTMFARSSPYGVCATADGICRLVEPFTTDGSPVAVVGSKGFVGSGVATQLTRGGHEVIPLDVGDDLGRIAEADIVVSATGRPGLLGAEQLRPHHRLVVDAGFSPQRGGSPLGDIDRAAYAVPQYVTPVPGGVGPVEMAVLMERLIRKDLDPQLPAWQLAPFAYRTRGGQPVGTATGTSATVAGRDLPDDRRPGHDLPGHGDQGRDRPPQPRQHDQDDRELGR